MRNMISNVFLLCLREKIKIPYDKPFIVIVGAGKRKTRVEWDDHYSVAQSPTFATIADNTVIKSLTFVVRWRFCCLFLLLI